MSRPDRTRRHYVRGLELAWHEWGPEDGPVVLCLHGFMDHGRAFDAMARALPDLRVVAPDMRGHGESGWIGAGGYYHFYDYFLDVRRLLARLGDPQLWIVGHSMGGSVAAGVASLVSEHVQGVLLLEGMGPPYSDPDLAAERLDRWVSALGTSVVDGDVARRRSARRRMPSRAEAVRRLRFANPRLSEARAEALAESFTEPAMKGGWVWRFDPLHRTPSVKPFLEAEARALWGKIRSPCVSLFGERGFHPPDVEDRHRVLGAVTVGWIPEAGHNLHHEQPELVAEALRRLQASPFGGLPPGVHPGLPPPEPRPAADR